MSRLSEAVSAPRENVLFVPNRNVLLTRSGWESGRTRSIDHDPAGERPTGGTEESAKETDQAKASGGGAWRDGKTIETHAERTEAERRQRSHPWFARASFEAADPGGGSGQDRGDSVAGSIPGIRAD